MSESDGGSYWQATRHPWPCLLFLLPLMVAYEGGILLLGGTEELRTGTDTWLRWTLQLIGLRALFWLPATILVVFFAWTCRRWGDRPADTVGVWVGMATESVVFALLLWGLSRLQEPVLEQLGLTVSTANVATAGVPRAVSFLGAEIYEELLFRLLLYPLLLWAIGLTGAPRALTILLALVLSAAIFAAAHHIGPYGEAYDPRVFSYRFLAGAYFALLFQFRGFGIAVGTHACFDVIVGVAMV